MSRNRTAMLVVGTAISALLLWLAMRNLQLEEFGNAMRQVDYRQLVPLTACLLAFYWVRTYRWKLLLGHLSRIPTADLFGPVMIGYGANFLLPFQFGELARSFAARSRTKLPFMSLAFSIVVERLFDFMVILFALALALLFHRHLPEYLQGVGLATVAILAGVIAVSFVFAIYTEPAIAVVGRCLGWVSTQAREAIQQQLRLGAQGLYSLLDGAIVLNTALVSLAQWTVFIGCIWIALHAVGITASVPTLLLILALTVLGSSVPNAPGYLGSIQAGFVLGLEATDGDAAKGLAASAVFHLVYAVTAVGIGALALRRARIDLRAIGDATDGDAAAAARTGEGG